LTLASHCVTFKKQQAAQTHVQQCVTTGHVNHSIVTPRTLSPHSWQEQHAPPDPKSGLGGSTLIPPGTAGYERVAVIDRFAHIAQCAVGSR
jgi:hypothetical protein